MNNLSPDSKEYEDTQGTVNISQEQAAVCTEAAKFTLSSTHRRALPASVCGCVFRKNLFVLIWHVEMVERANLDFFVFGGNPPRSHSKYFLPEDSNV